MERLSHNWQAVWLDKIIKAACDLCNVQLRKGTMTSLLMPPPRMEKETVAETGAVRERYVEDTPLLINIKGCGYPPTIVCDDYAETYSNYSLVTASCLVCVTVPSDVAGRSNLPLLLLPDEPVDRAVPVQRGRGGHQRRHDNTVTSRL